MSEQHFDSIESAIADIAAGKLVIVTDDHDRENEGDLVMAASKATPELINMMILHARGLICVPTTSAQLTKLGIGQMVRDNRESHQTDFSISVDAADGITTGISAYDRATTIQLLADPQTTPDKLVQPGHIFPLRARPGGVLQRAGHTEAAVDLASLAGLHPSGVICEILNEDGTMARLPELKVFKEKFGLKLITIADLIEYRHKRECLIKEISKGPFKTAFGEYTLHIFRSVLDERTHYALVKGTLDQSPTLVRVHSENILKDVFHFEQNTSKSLLQSSLEAIEAEGKGVLLYIEQLNGGIDLNKIEGKKTADINDALSNKMDIRDYGIGAQILSALGLEKIKILSNNPHRVVALEGYNLEITDHVILS